METEYVYIMEVAGAWQTRVPGQAHAIEHTNAEEALSAGRDFAWLRRCLGGPPIHVRIRRHDGIWIEIDNEGKESQLQGML